VVFIYKSGLLIVIAILMNSACVYTIHATILASLVVGPFKGYLDTCLTRHNLILGMLYFC
jgi:hypothetical protein